MNQIISMESLEREELAFLERKVKENVLRRQAAEQRQKEARAQLEQRQKEARAQQEQEMKVILQRAQERREENEAATMCGAIGGVALALGCVMFDALWVLLIALGWVLGVAWKAVRR